MSKRKINWISNALSSNRNQNSPLATDRDSKSVEDHSEAEFLLAIGKIVASRLRRGEEVESLAAILHCNLETLYFAKSFSLSPSSLIFKALMEGWSLEEIRTAACESSGCLATVEG